MSKKKMEKGERTVKAFRLNKSLVIVLPKDFCNQPAWIKQVLRDNKLILEVEGHGRIYSNTN